VGRRGKRKSEGNGGAIGGGTAGIVACIIFLIVVYNPKFFWRLFCSSRNPDPPGRMNKDKSESEDEDEDDLQQQQAKNVDFADASALEDVDVETQAAPPPPVQEFAKAAQPTEFAQPREHSEQNEPESALVCPPGHRHPNGKNIAVPDCHTVMQGVDGKTFVEPTQAVPPPQDEGVAEAQPPIKSAQPQENSDPAVNTSGIVAQPPAPALDCPPGHTMMRHPNGQIIAVPDGHTVMQGADGEIFFGKTQK
jgi:hypothetical protein